MALPDLFVRRLADIVPAETLAGVLSTFERPKHTGFRINRLKRAPADLPSVMRDDSLPWHELGWFPAGGYVEPPWRELLVRSPRVASGDLYIQNPSSILAALAVGAQPGEQVLDLAAAPGGKSMLLAECMQNQGYLAAVEPIRNRYFRLRQQLERAGVRIARTFLADGRRIGRRTPQRFDRVLLDAPCSGEARFRAEAPDRTHFWNLRKIREQSRKQRGLILSAIHALRPQGTLIYATCSFAPEENEAVVDFALRRAEGAVRLVPLHLPVSNIMPGLTQWQNRAYDPSLVHTVRILPNHLFDGLFLAQLTTGWPLARRVRL